jgi:hypothetical protein
MHGKVKCPVDETQVRRQFVISPRTRDNRGDPQAATVSIPFVGTVAGPPVIDGLSGLGGTADPGLSPAGGFLFPVLGFFCVFFGMVIRWRHPKVRIRSSPPYSCSGGASSSGRGRMESCVRRISWDLVGFRDCLCGFRSVSFDLRFSSSAMVAALVRWSFGALARWLHVCLLQQALLR